MRPYKKERTSSQSQPMVQKSGSDSPLHSSFEIYEETNEEKNHTRKIFKKKFLPFYMISAFVLVIVLIALSVIFIRKFKLYCHTNPDVIVTTSVSSNSYETIENNENHSKCNTTACYQASNFIVDYLNQTINPCENFYEFACGNQYHQHKENTDHFTMAYDKMLKDISEIFYEPIDTNNSETVKNFKRFYKSCLDDKKIEMSSDKDILNYLRNDLGDWPMVPWNKSDNFTSNNEFQFEKYVANLSLLNIPLIFRFESDDINNTRILMRVITTRDYCAIQPLIPENNDKIKLEKFKRLLLQLKEYFYEDMPIMSVKDSHEQQNFTQQFDEMIELARIIYFINTDKYQCNSKNKPNIINKDLILTVDQLNSEINKKNREKNLPTFDFRKFINRINEKTNANFKPDSLIAIKTLNLNYLSDFFYNLGIKYNFHNDYKFERAMKNFAYFHTIFDTLQLTEVDSHTSLPIRYYQAVYEYVKYVQAYYQPSLFFKNIFNLDREKSCAIILIDTFDIHASNEQYEFQKFYLNKKFNKNTKNFTKKMLDELIKTSIEQVKSQNWIDEEAQMKINEQFKSMEFRIAFSDNLYSSDNQINNNYYNQNSQGLYKLSDSYINNRLILKKVAYAKQFELIHLKQTQVERIRSQKYIFSIFVANLLYLQAYNTMLMPAGTFIEPVFSIDFPMYLNFATVGVYMSHEIWHMMHEQILTTKSSETYEKKIKCITDNYVGYAKNKYNIDIDGIEALNEQTADYFGILNSYKTYIKLYNSGHGRRENSLPGLDYTSEQLFFIRYAQSYCRKQVLTEYSFKQEHGIHEFRVFQTVLLKEFNKAFKCDSKKPQKYQIENTVCDTFS